MAQRPADVVPLGEATRTWARVAMRSFGGPAGQIAVMHREVVDERRWVGEQRFLHALSYCTVLPGPEAQQLATYLGWLLNGPLGGLIAGGLFVLPGFVSILALSMVYAQWGETTAVAAVFAGVSPAVIAIVIQAAIRVGRRTLRSRFHMAVAGGAFVSLAVLAVPFPIVIVVAAVLGTVVARWLPAGLAAHAPAADGPEPLISDVMLHSARPSAARAVAVTAIGAALWVAPVALIALWLGGDSVLVDQARFFGGTALVTFGGAYAVLSYVAQRAVEVYGWLAPGEMTRGLAMAETTPGPLIQVVQFVGFMGAFRAPGELDPWVAAVLASVVVTWVTYVPCFVFVFVGAPYVERMRTNRSLTAALSAVTAAVVGVIANLAVFFCVHTLFDRAPRRRWGPFETDVPEWHTFSPAALLVTAVALVMVFRLRWSVLRVLAGCAVLGATIHLATV